MLHRMPTSNPRISVTLTPTVAAVLRELTSLTGESQSATIAGLLEMSAPVFERIIHALRAAKVIQEHAQHGVKQEIAEGLESAQERLEHQFNLAMDRVDDVFLPVIAQSEQITRRAGRGVADGGARLSRAPDARSRKVSPEVLTPRPVTRGSGPLTAAASSGKKGAARGRV
jgi:hypothetical protein